MITETVKDMEKYFLQHGTTDTTYDNFLSDAKTLLSERPIACAVLNEFEALVQRKFHMSRPVNARVAPALIKDYFNMYEKNVETLLEYLKIPNVRENIEEREVMAQFYRYAGEEGIPSLYLFPLLSNSDPKHFELLEQQIVSDEEFCKAWFRFQLKRFVSHLKKEEEKAYVSG